jgi:hypothetical protein
LAIVIDPPAVEEWIRLHAEPLGAIETVHEPPWATVLRVPLAEDVAWFKACAPVQAFEPLLTAELFARWPDRVPEVLGYNEERGWLLLADAGKPVAAFGNPPEAWLNALVLVNDLLGPVGPSKLASEPGELVVEDVRESFQEDEREDVGRRRPHMLPGIE